MYKSFTIRNFRGFHKFNIADFERINLIAGPNNVGKTAFLEALFLHTGAYNISLVLTIEGMRGIPSMKIEFSPRTESPWDSFFFKFDASKSIELEAVDTEIGYRGMRLRLVTERSELGKVSRLVRVPSDDERAAQSGIEPIRVFALDYFENKSKKNGRTYYMISGPRGVIAEPLPPAAPVLSVYDGARTRIAPQEDAERFGMLESQGKHEIVLRALQIIEPRLSRLTVIVAGGIPMLHGDIGLGRLVPLPLMGGGMNRLASLVVEIGFAPKGVVLIDEVENGLHHSVLPNVWRSIAEAARTFDTQVFATTHSFECIAAAQKAFSEDSEYDFRLYRFERAAEEVRVVSYEKETLAAAIETGLEVR